MKSLTEKLHRDAIEAAIAQKWKEAESINKQIIGKDPNHTDAHLGLGFALLQQNKFDLSKTAYRKALRLDPGNTIARNNLDKIKILEKKGRINNHEITNELLYDPNSFITVAGKTKYASLINIGQAVTIAHLKVGTRLQLQIKKRKVEVRTDEAEYIGTLPDDISKRMMFFLGAGSTYSVYTTGVSKSSVDVFIKEEKKGKRVLGFTSFPKNIQDDLKHLTLKPHAERTHDEEHVDDNADPLRSPFDLEEIESDLEEEKSTYLSGFDVEGRDDSEFEE